MTPLLANWTIVLVGKWNVEILNPDWVASNIFGADNLEIEMVLDGMATNIRYAAANVFLVPKRDKIILSVGDTRDETLQLAEIAAGKVLSSLPVTPVAALGINFTFKESAPTALLANALNVNDTSMLSDKDYVIKRTSITRKIDYEDRDLNLIITQLNDGAIRVATNYHAVVKDAQEAALKLGKKVVELRNNTISMLDNIYDLKLQESE